MKIIGISRPQTRSNLLILLAMLLFVPNANAATPVACGDNLSTPGNYVLEADLECTKPIKITSSKVKLDLGGHTLSCSSPDLWEFPPAADNVPPEDLNKWISGIEVNFLDVFGDLPRINKVHVKNGSVTNCHDGIFVYNTDKSKFTNLNLSGNNASADCCGSRGLELLDSNDNKVTNNVMSENYQGLILFYSDGNKITGNQLPNNASDGIVLVGSSDNSFSANQAEDNLWGIWLESGSHNNKIVGNKFNRNGDSGIALIAENNGNDIRGNEVNDNGYFNILWPGGIVVIGAPDFGAPVPAGNTIQANKASGNSVYDLVEAVIVDFTPGNYFVPDDCSNAWKSNKSTTEFGPVGCID